MTVKGRSYSIAGTPTSEFKATLIYRLPHPAKKEDNLFMQSGNWS
ncbi:MAG: hypothetical protein WC958_01100 [Dehalococcoidales bacterium]